MKHPIVLLFGVFVVLIALFATPLGGAVLLFLIDYWFLFLPLFLIILWLLFKPKKQPKMPVEPDFDQMKDAITVRGPEIIDDHGNQDDDSGE